jgi:pyruvate carboxylase subunit B
MPGLVLVLEVAEGDSVEKGQGILIIEAMKMENEIRAPIAGVVRGLAVSAGDAVERDALLCTVEPE